MLTIVIVEGVRRLKAKQVLIMQRLEPLEAAKQFISQHFPNCEGAILAGSVVRGEATATSDLDIVVFDHRLSSAYRESLFDFGWPIEVFVHNLTSYKDFFRSDYQRARPSLPRMVSEGIVLQDTGIVNSIKQEAADLLHRGPAEWTHETITTKRYFLTDLLDDFMGSIDKNEEVFIANALAEAVHEFVLRTNGHWIGASKWIVRALKRYDEVFAEKFTHAFNEFYKKGDKSKVESLVDQVLEPHGGRLFAGYSMGKR